VTFNRHRTALWLWILLAFVVWNVVFDRVIIDAGRAFVRTADAAALAGGPYARIDDWMRPARTRALWWATSSAVAILGVGLTAVRRASRAA